MFPQVVPDPIPSRKKNTMPIRTITIVMTSLRSGFFFKSSADKRISQIGAEYCRTMALAAVVSLFATINSVVTPPMQMAPMKILKLKRSL